MGWFITVTLVLFILKIFGLISISWWWVFSPLILATVIFLIAFVVALYQGIR